MGSTKIGALIFLSLIISVIVLSLILPHRRNAFKPYGKARTQGFNPVLSVCSAGRAAIIVFSFIAIFSALAELLKKLLAPTIFTFTLPFLEISTALVHIITKENLHPTLRLLLVGFSVGFGGLSANLQCAAFLSEKGIKVLRFFLAKLILGLICSAVTVLLLSLLGF